MKIEEYFADEEATQAEAMAEEEERGKWEAEQQAQREAEQQAEWEANQEPPSEEPY